MSTLSNGFALARFFLFAQFDAADLSANCLGQLIDEFYLSLFARLTDSATRRRFFQSGSGDTLAITIRLRPTIILA
jgi:hypothetical protein